MERRVILLTTSFPRHASDEAGVFVARLALALSDAGMRGTVIVPKDTSTETLESCGHFAVKRPRYGIWRPGSLAFGAGIIPNLKQNPLLFLQVPALLLSLTLATVKASRGATIVSAHWILCGLCAWVNNLLRSTPYTVTVRGEDFRLLGLPLIGGMLRPTLRRAHAVVTVSREFAEKLGKIPGLDRNKISVVENGADNFTSEELDTAPDPGINKPFLLFAGTVVERKRLDILIGMLSQKPLADYSLAICGRLAAEDEVAKLRQLADTLGVTGRVTFEGAVAPASLAGYLKHASAYVSASAFEGRPNSVLEALAAGKVVLLSDIPAHREIVENGRNGILFSEKMTEEGAETLVALLDNQPKRERMQEAAKNSVAHLTWSKAALAYRKIFESI